MHTFSDQLGLPCVVMRGGTSKGPFFLESDLPPPGEQRDRILLRVLGALEPRRIDGIGGPDPLVNKIAIISPSKRADADVDYLFAQVCIHKNTIDYNVNCGNMLAAVGPYAIDQGLVKADGLATTVRIFNVNTAKRIVATVQTNNGRVLYQGDARIDGVPDQAAPVWLRFEDMAGAKTGKLLPTGNVVDIMNGIEVSCVDAAVPMAIVAADAFGLTGHESAEVINANADLLAKVEDLRCTAGRAMGLGDVSRSEMPKLTLVAAPASNDATLAARYFMPYTCHSGFAVTGAVCLGVAAFLGGSVAQRVARQTTGPVRIEHPQGSIEVDVQRYSAGAGGDPDVRAVSLLRTARRLFAGTVYVPDTLVAEAPESILQEIVTS
ncbi:MAG: 4-oxalomesaconate tautomerase [Advenella sp.]|uniref:4-oxalomesaconate tautomerase n=1 Tax=Advenella kashmirensis TaxID=310575 RepID=A0A356LAP2_9BURK|nr:4-oxalomesaconate tautomerase [Advenella sp. FME57]HBP28066.1 4-oxalomesaconate tautomerase [Advenella kashmirensis]